MSLVRIEDLHIHLGEFHLEGVSFSLEKGDYLNIIGPTGAGKTILLESIVGFWKPDKGRVFLEERDITDEQPEKRQIGIVYQDYALLPHFTVRKNIAYGLKKRQKHGVDEKVRAMAVSLQIDHLLDRLPGTLSGGEQQRAALARALIVEPKLLLMDEPFSALDPQTRRQARILLKRAIQDRGTTVLHITHDLADAWALANKVAILKKGQCLQFGPLEDVFNRPKTPFIADFVGANILEGKVEKQESGLCDVRSNGFCLVSSDSAALGSDVHVAIRPENIVVSKKLPPPSPDRNVLEAILETIVREGTTCTLQLRSQSALINVLVANNALERLSLREGDRVYALIRSDNVRIT